MRRSLLVAGSSVAALVAVGSMLPGLTRADPATPMPPGAVGISAAVLGAIDPVAAPGYELQLFRSEWAPGSTINTHNHPGALVSCVESGQLHFEIQTGAASLIRAHGAGTPTAPEAIAPNQPIVYGPGDCVAFDQDAADTVHTAWNDGSAPAVLWEAHLYRAGKPATTFTNEQGTPAP
jgi:hypothetical protein